MKAALCLGSNPSRPAKIRFFEHNDSVLLVIGVYQGTSLLVPQYLRELEL
jgi:hypothetical protein